MTPELQDLIDSLIVEVWREASFESVDRFSYLLGVRSAIIRLNPSYCVPIINTFVPVMEQAMARNYHGETPGKWS